MDPYYGAARLWFDAIIDPAATRAFVARGIAAAGRNTEIPRFNPGVIQT